MIDNLKVVVLEPMSTIITPQKLNKTYLSSPCMNGAKPSQSLCGILSIITEEAKVDTNHRDGHIEQIAGLSQVALFQSMFSYW